jgi:hypothetical protein
MAQERRLPSGHEGGEGSRHAPKAISGIVGKSLTFAKLTGKDGAGGVSSGVGKDGKAEKSLNPSRDRMTQRKTFIGGRRNALV